MKSYIALATTLLALSAPLHAYSLDFAALLGTTLPPEITVSVGDYGNVRITNGVNYLDGTNDLVVGTQFGSTALEMTPGDTFWVSFLSGPVDILTATTIDQALTENLFISANTDKTIFRVALQAPTGSNGLGITSLNFAPAAVPEPSALMISILGASALVLKRRR